MKLIKYLVDGTVHAGVVDGTDVISLACGAEVGMMARWLSPQGRSAAQERAGQGGARSRLADVRCLPPLSPTSRLFCIGINYKSHASETGRDLPAQPSVFLRTAESVVGHGQPLQLPVVSSHFDYEGELAVVIGTAARNITPDQALDCVAGYTCFNDGSLRDFQKHSVTAGKNFDASGACGPWIVTADEIPDPTQLTLTTRLNGTQVQHATTDLLIYPIPLILSYLSRFTALRPGDIVATGTPAGVGARREPPLWMRVGDTVEVEISSIGVLRNTVAKA